MAKMSNEERARSEQWSALSFGERIRFMKIHKKWSLISATIILMLALFSLVDCMQKTRLVETHSKGEGVEKNNKQYRLDSNSDFQDGTYVYNKRVANGLEECKLIDAKCLNLTEYKIMCLKVRSITKSLASTLPYRIGTPAFSTLLESGFIERIEGKWIPKSHFTNDSGIEGSCEVNIIVSGTYKGTSVRESDSIYAKTFIISEKDIVLHEGEVSAF